MRGRATLRRRGRGGSRVLSSSPITSSPLAITASQIERDETDTIANPNFMTTGLATRDRYSTWGWDNYRQQCGFLAQPPRPNPPHLPGPSHRGYRVVVAWHARLSQAFWGSACLLLVAAASEQRASHLPFPPSLPYPPVLARSNHKILKRGSRYSRCH